MKAKLFCKAGKLAGASFEVHDEAVIGRGSTNEVVLRHESISGQHARLSFDSKHGRYVIEDLGSLNGTEVDGLPISGPEVLDHLHVITFAEDHDFIFHALDIAVQGTAPAPGHDITAIELAVPIFPEPARAVERHRGVESTRVDREVVILPQDLVELAVSEAEDPGEEDQHGTEKTRIETDFQLPLRVLQEAAGALGAESEVSFDDRDEGKSPAADESDRGNEDLDTGDGDEAVTEGTVDEGAGVSDAAVGRVDRQQVVTSPELESQSPFAALAAHDRWFLEVEELDGQSRRFELCEGENLIGRGAEMQIQLETLELSRRHAALLLDEARLVIRDEGGQNGTFVEGERLVGQREIQPGARLRFATVAATVNVQAHPNENGS